MKTKNRKPALFPLILLSVSLACSGLQSRTAQSIPQVSRHSSYKEALISAVALADPPSMQPHNHASDMFSYEAPRRWRIDSSAFGVIIHSPTSIILSVFVINTGYKLSTSSFMKLTSNVENTNYGAIEQYRVVSRYEDRQNHLVSVDKTYLLDGVGKTAHTVYRQEGQSMYVIEMTADRIEITDSPKYEALFAAFNQSIRDRQAAKSAAPAYASSWQYTESADRFSMRIPTGWQSLTTQPLENLTRIQFRSPDGNAQIESFFLDMSHMVDVGFAADYALELLDAAYAKGSDDIRVISEVNLVEFRSEQITWISRSGGYMGVTYFEVRNKTHIFILTRAWNRLFDDIYSPVTDTVIASFRPKVPLE